MTIELNTKLMNPDELTEFLNISKSSLYRLVESGKIPHIKVGGSLRFERNDIIEYLEKNRIELIT